MLMRSVRDLSVSGVPVWQRDIGVNSYGPRRVEETGDVSSRPTPRAARRLPDVGRVCVVGLCRMSTSYNYSKVIPEPMGSFYYETDE